MRKSLFAGLSILEAGDSLSDENGAFIGRDREIIDRLLEVGAKTHRHTGLAGLSNPSVAASAGVHASAGLIGADLGLSIGYTLEDSAGGETMLSPLAVVSTAPAMDGPDQAPTAEASHASGVLPVNTYFYCVTFTDGEGGETLAGPAVSAERQPGFEAGQVLLSDLEAGMAAAGAAGWRLYRAIGGGTFDLLASGGAGEDTFADLGVVSPNCTIHPPLESTTTGLSTLLVTLPSGGLQTAESINLYGSVTGDFSGGSLLGQYPVSSAGHTVVFRKFEADAASPPPVNLSVGGAHQIDPDTDILDWHWKRPVAGSAALGSGTQGDVRLVTGSGKLYAILAASASAAPGWREIASAGTGGGGAEGRAPGYRYKWSSSIEVADPGAGKFRADNATFGAITFLLLSETDLDGNNVAVPISSWDDSTSTVRGTVEIRKVGAGSVFRLFNITGGRTDNGAWDALPVAPVAGAGTLNDGDEVFINVTRTGDKGDTGTTGTTGATGASGAEGPAGVPVVLAGGNPGSATGTKSVSATKIEGTNTGAIGTAGAIDGVTVKAGDWIFVFTGSKNDGVWEVANAGGVGVRWVLERPNGLNTSQRVERTMFWVKGGSTANQAGKVFYCSNEGITLGTTELVFRRLWNNGVAEPEFSGGVKSSVVTVNHELGVTPSNIELTVMRSEAGEVLMVPHIISGSENATSFKVGALGATAFGAGVKAPIKWRAER